MSDDLVQRVRDELYAVIDKPQSYCEAIARAIIPLVVEYERERCAAFLDTQAAGLEQFGDNHAEIAKARRWCAAAIRAGNP